MRMLPAVLVSISFVFVAGAAHADPRTHDGFQFRGAIGPGYLSTTEEVSGGGASLPKVTVSGVASAMELYFGGTPVPGLAIGGMLDFTIATGPSVSFEGGGSATASDDYSLNFLTIGPYADYYLDPAGGFHLMGTVGYGAVNASSKNSSSNASTGIAFGLGVGYDWWIGDEWSIGVLGRFTYASLSQERQGVKATDNTLSPALLLAFTLH